MIEDTGNNAAHAAGTSSNTVESQLIEESNTPVTDLSVNVEDRRTIDVMFFIEQLKNISDHGAQFRYTLQNLDAIREK